MVDFKNYFPGTATYRNLPAINMLSTRGCPGACVFCNSAFTTLRTRDPTKVAEQIRHLRETYGIRQVQFYDDTFTVMKKFVIIPTLLLFIISLAKFQDWAKNVRLRSFSGNLPASMALCIIAADLYGI